MERVFCKDKKDFCDCIESCRKCQFAKGNGVISGYIAHDLLATLFGNDYDLSRLRELAQADREGRRAALPYKKWVHLGGDEWCCSSCGNVIYTEGSWEKPGKKYCEECGAKMDVEQEE